MHKQPLSAKIGEITYRAKIVQQQLGKKSAFENEPSSREFKRILKEKLKGTEKTFKLLQNKGVILSPYLEIGSEHCLRPAMLESKFNASGFATDISLYSLARAKEFSKQFNFKKTPKTICADAENLPFKSNSFPFVFVYETLHHFPHPKPVLLEIYRVLAPGGVCLIGGDPIRQSFQIGLWRRPNKLRGWEKILKLFLLLPFISHIGKTEVAHGILEEAFLLSYWREALSAFDEARVTVKAYPFGPSETIIKSGKANWLSPRLTVRVALNLFGGGLEAVCVKRGKIISLGHNIVDSLICPNCRKVNSKEIPLHSLGVEFYCRNCHREYKKYKNVLLLLDANTAKAFGQV